MCRYLLLTDLNMAQSFFADMQENGFMGSGDGNAASPGLGSSSSSSLWSGVSGAMEGSDAGCGGLGDGGASVGFMPPPPGNNSRKFAEETRKEFSLLSEAANRWDWLVG